MIRTTLVSALALTALGGAFIAGRTSVTPGTITLAAQPDDEQAMMDAMMKAAEPNEHHARLAKGAGDWNAHTKFAMGPGEFAEGDGAMGVEVIMGGRYTQSHFTGTFAGMPFTGMGINGYDNLKGQYVGIWIDSFGTGITFLSGQEENGKLVMTGKSNTPQGENDMKIVSDFAGADTMVDTFYDKIDGQWVQTGTITYTRK